MKLSHWAVHPAGVWVIKNLISPIDRFVMRLAGGRIPPPSSLSVPTLLLTVVGRRSGLERTVPLVYVADGANFVVGNARPPGERRNPWIANLRAAGRAEIQRGTTRLVVSACELDVDEVERWWPALTGIWPPFGDHYAATGERTLFVLAPLNDVTNQTKNSRKGVRQRASRAATTYREPT